MCSSPARTARKVAAEEKLSGVHCACRWQASIRQTVLPEAHNFFHGRQAARPPDKDPQDPPDSDPPEPPIPFKTAPSSSPPQCTFSACILFWPAVRRVPKYRWARRPPFEISHVLEQEQTSNPVRTFVASGCLAVGGCRSPCCEKISL